MTTSTQPLGLPLGPQYYYIMNKTFREVFEEEREVATSVANHWGYGIRSTGLDTRMRKANEDRVPVVANINTLRLTKDIPKTSRILQIEEELRGIENGRLLAKFTEEAAKKGADGRDEENGKSPIIALMEEKVREYNHIVLHKHLDKHYNEETRRILKIDRDAGEELIEQMGEGQQRQKEGNLNAQIRLNKYMAQLYKSYRAHLQQQRIHPSESSNAKTMVSEPAKSARNTYKHQEIPKLDRLRHFGRQHSQRKAAKTRSDKALLINIHAAEHSLRLTHARVNSQHGHSPYLSSDQPACLTDRTSSRRTGSRQQQERILRTIGSPFIDREKLQEYRRIEKSNNNNYATLGMFRSKISDYKGKVTDITQNKHKPTTRPKNNTIITENPRTYHSFSTHAHVPNAHEEAEMSEDERRVYRSIVNDNQEKYSEQKGILAQLLKKKRNKYNKVGLSRVLVKYDQEEEAKWLLKGLPHKHTQSPPPTHQQTQLSDGLEESDPAEDDEHYQRMCKNEKINLLLKHR